MTPEQQALRDAWLAEMWKPVKEYVAPIDPRQSQPVDRPGDKRRRAA